MKLLSNRIKNMSESATLAMTRKSRELKEAGNDVINLSIGEPDFFTPEPIKAAAKEAIDNNITQYPPVAGFKELRETVSAKLKRDNGLDFAPAQIVVSTGAKQAIANVVMSVVNPGEEVIVPAPYWVSYAAIIKLAEGTPCFIPTSIEKDFKVTPEEVEAAITPNTKAFLFSSPCNPSGSLYTKKELEGLAKVFEKYPDIIIISDEIYELINFEGKHQSIAQFKAIKERVVIVNGVSKGFAMTGWRLGYCAAPEYIAKACDKFQGQITSGTCTISQMAAIKALNTAPSDSDELKEMIKAFRNRRDRAIDLLKNIPGVLTNTPKGAFYIFPNVTSYYGKKFNGKTIENGTDLCMFLLNEAHVALVPGEAFGAPDCIRLSYATSMEQLEEAINRISKGLSLLK